MTVCFVCINCQCCFFRIFKVNLFATWKSGDGSLQMEIGHVTILVGGITIHLRKQATITVFLLLYLKEINLFLNTYYSLISPPALQKIFI